ncbi:putative cardiolipin synthase [Formivibrio citricus]|uniref:Cardiolipin synthase B n=1 Tax=Formivibrio citricus TaxID=83765 RepID=A0A1I4XDB5_9NEIS|nr:cardiolipin synthase ClsB [Formivibrio citricus]SFN23887.1 putative cardiolipin synthase [Formivibrio citricus]
MPGYVKGNRLRLLFNGVEYFPSLLEAIRSARHEILIETYIYEFDEIGEAVADALTAAVARGVVVKLLLDGFGAAGFPQAQQDRLLAAGVQVLFFRPEAGRSFFARTRLRRLHRKLVVIDGEVGFVGGINIISDYNQDIADLAPRYDYAVEVRGPLVPRMHASMSRLWRRSAWARFKHEWLRRSHLRPVGEIAGAAEARFVVRDTLRHRRDIEREYLRAIESAKREIVIANAYFLPGWRFRHALKRAAARGVRVVLLLQGVTEYVLLHHATRGFYHQLLAAGTEIHEYRKGFMHAKVAVIDGLWSTVGSSNLDPFSLLLAREANVFVRDGEFSGILRADLQRVLDEDSVQIRLEDLHRAGWFQRVMDWACFGLTRLMMGFSGYGGKRYLE